MADEPDKIERPDGPLSLATLDELWDEIRSRTDAAVMMTFSTRTKDETDSNYVWHGPA